jgi:hypothetical protein
VKAQGKATPKSSGYHPNNSRVADDTLANFLRAPISGELLEVPGIGPRAKELLASEEGGMFPITNTFQLIGLFFSLKRDNMDSRQHCDQMWNWLQHKGVNAYRSGIVLSIAEKCNTMTPGIYDASVFAE